MNILAEVMKIVEDDIENEESENDGEIEKEERFVHDEIKKYPFKVGGGGFDDENKFFEIKIWMM